jgi:small redox-active disulfide protein 2
MIIKIFGPGCPKCNEAEKTVRAALAEAAIEADVEKVSDFQQMAAHGIFSTPAVMVDGEVKCTGRAPSKSDVLGWVKQS